VLGFLLVGGYWVFLSFFFVFFHFASLFGPFHLSGLGVGLVGLLVLGGFSLLLVDGSCSAGCSAGWGLVWFEARIFWFVVAGLLVIALFT